MLLETWDIRQVDVANKYAHGSASASGCTSWGSGCSRSPPDALAHVLLRRDDDGAGARGVGGSSGTALRAGPAPLRTDPVLKWTDRDVFPVVEGELTWMKTESSKLHFLAEHTQERKVNFDRLKDTLLVHVPNMEPLECSDYQCGHKHRYK